MGSGEEVVAERGPLALPGESVVPEREMGFRSPDSKSGVAEGKRHVTASSLDTTLLWLSVTSVNIKDKTMMQKAKKRA